MSHKKAFDVLDDLINNEWRTDVNLITDEEGRAYFRGFFGDYTVKIGKTSEERQFHKENTGYYHVTCGPMEQKIII